MNKKLLLTTVWLVIVFILFEASRLMGWATDEKVLMAWGVSYVAFAMWVGFTLCWSWTVLFAVWNGLSLAIFVFLVDESPVVYPAHLLIMIDVLTRLLLLAVLGSGLVNPSVFMLTRLGKAIYFLLFVPRVSHNDNSVALCFLEPAPRVRIALTEYFARFGLKYLNCRFYSGLWWYSYFRYDSSRVLGSDTNESVGGTHNSEDAPTARYCCKCHQKINGGAATTHCKKCLGGIAQLEHCDEYHEL